MTVTQDGYKDVITSSRFEQDELMKKLKNYLNPMANEDSHTDVFHYGFVYRRSSEVSTELSGFHGFDAMEGMNDIHKEASPHGTVSFNRQLTAEEVRKWELSVLVDEAGIDKLVNDYIDDMLSRHGYDLTYANVFYSGHVTKQEIGEEIYPNLVDYARSKYGGDVVFDERDALQMRIANTILTKCPNSSNEAHIERRNDQEVGGPDLAF